MQIETKKIEELTPAPYNPRKISNKELERLKRSLDEFGVVEPVIWNKRTGYVVGGHQRLKAMKELGIEETDYDDAVHRWLRANQRKYHYKYYRKKN